MKFVGVLDRFEGEKGILLIGVNQEQLCLSRNQLPAGAREGDVFRIDIDFDAYGTLFRQTDIHKRIENIFGE